MIPSARVVAMGGAPAPDYHIAVIREIERQFPGWPWRSYLDVFAMHMYPPAETPAARAPRPAGEEFRKRVRDVYGKPVWNTEGGALGPGLLPHHERCLGPLGAADLPIRVRPPVHRGLAAGGRERGDQPDRDAWATVSASTSTTTSGWRRARDLFKNHPSALEYDDTVRPKGIAISAFAKLLDHSTGLGPLATGDDYTRAFLFDRRRHAADRPVHPGQRQPVGDARRPRRPQLRLYDVMGNRLPVGDGTILLRPPAGLPRSARVSPSRRSGKPSSAARSGTGVTGRPPT